MFISSWSGGKDSCLACYKALKEGYEIASLVNFISREYKRVRFHGTDSKLIQIQSELSGIPLCQKETPPDDYEGAFKDAVKSLVHHENNSPLPPFSKGGMGGLSNEIKGMIFGDIYIEEHKQWVERVCKEIGIEAIEPLWGRNTEEIMQEFINNCFHAVIVSGQAKFIDKKWIGQPINRDFWEYLKTKNDVDICGENGEYHTFVVAGPLFNGRIEITEKDVIQRDGYWFLDIRNYEVIV